MRRWAQFGAGLAIGALAAAPAWAQAPAAPISVAEVLTRLKSALAAYPTLIRELGDVPARLDASAAGGLGPLTYIFALSAALAAMLGAEYLIRAACRGLKERLGRRLTDSAAPQGWFLLLWAVDALAVGGAWIVSAVAPAFGLRGNEGQTVLTFLALSSLLYWRLYLLVFRAWLRPELPQTRIVPVDDADARLLYSRLALLMVPPLIVRVAVPFLLSMPVERAAGQAAALTLAILVFATYLYCVFSAREAAARWFAGLVGPQATYREFKLTLARYWWIPLVALYACTWLAHGYAVLSARYSVVYGFTATYQLLFGLVLFETLVSHAVHRRVATPAEGPRAVDTIARCLRLAARLVFVVSIAQIWVVQVLAVVPGEQWQKRQDALFNAAIVLYIAYVLWQFSKYRIDRYLARNKVAATSFNAEADPEERAPGTATRLRTLLPVLRVALNTVIVVTAGLIALSELGVNITPLLAGASILGLAISFGSQSLVKDIVSGIFYLAEDAFRVGEYIDSGKVKGTVESFTVRSMRLRHQNGQLHIIPFGQLGSITNFSRDWTTVKFNLPMARATDIELLRKTAKKIGQELMGDPAIAKDVLVPLKLQGIADIKENALIMRFKFTAKPTNPSYIQRQAVKRMYEVFPGKGLHFADATVSVQALNAGADPVALAAAGAAGKPA